MSKSKKFNEEEMYNDIVSENNVDDIVTIKRELSQLLPKDIKIKSENDSQKKLINSIRNNEITIVAGPPGTGKTFVSVAYALALLRKQENKFKKIFLIKSVTTLKGEEIGFLKGDIREKFEPYMWSYFINMEKVIPSSTLNTLISKEYIRPFPLAYMKGASLDNCIIIADEMQNISIDNSRTLLTRIGRNSKLIVLGDINQIDLKNKKESSLEKMLEMFKDTNKIGVIQMSESDTNVRNPLISTIEEKYKELNKTKNNE